MLHDARRAPRPPSTLEIGASRGMKTSHGTPRDARRERQRLRVVARAAGDHAGRAAVASAASLFSAPRILNEPVRWRFSALSEDVAARALAQRRATAGPACGARRRAPLASGGDVLGR